MIDPELAAQIFRIVLHFLNLFKNFSVCQIFKVLANFFAVHFSQYLLFAHFPPRIQLDIEGDRFVRKGKVVLEVRPGVILGHGVPLLVDLLGDLALDLSDQQLARLVNRLSVRLWIRFLNSCINISDKLDRQNVITFERGILTDVSIGYRVFDKISR